MKRRTLQVIIGGMTFIIILTVIVLISLNRFMDRQTLTDVQRIAGTYLEGVASGEINNYIVVADIRYSQLNYLSDELDALGENASGDEIERIAAEYARLQELPSFAFVDEDGVIHTVHGGEIMSLGNHESLVEKMKAKEPIVMTGKSSEQDLIVWAAPASYPLKNGKKAIGMLYCRELDQFVKNMHLSEVETLARFLLVRKDGSYVFRTEESVGDTYYDKLLRYTKPVDGTAEEKVADLKEHIDADEAWSMEVIYEDPDRGIKERRSVRVDVLPNSNWYLVSLLPYGVLDETIEGMSAARNKGMMIALSVLCAGILIVVGIYMRMTRGQIRALEKARRAADDANKAKSEFLSNMSHDIRTPMNAIIGMTAIASDHLDDTDRVKDCLKKINLSGKHLLGLINDVLDMSKIESGKMTLNLDVISLRQTMEVMCDIVRPQIKVNKQQFDIIIKNIISEKVYCDDVRLNQVLLNFLSNAMKFTPEGGQIHVNLWQEPSDKGDAYVKTHLIVKDNGMGMSEEFQKKLFRSFEREDNKRVHKTQGTGLGLTITKYIVEAMGGTIEVDSKAGVGTSFHVIIDFERAPEDEGEMVLPDWRILVVDDNEEVCQSAELSLRELGARPDTCRSGEEAVSMVLKAHEEGDDYYALLIDYLMEGMNGVQTAQKINEVLDENIPISLISAYDWSDIEEKAIASGITGFIPKPLFKSTLYHELKKSMCEEIDGGVEVTAGSDKFSLNGMHILLPEDNDINAEIATMILEENGATVERAEDGQMAVDMFKDSEVGYYDAILMDLRMPNLNGFEATDRIRAMEREDAKKIPIIALTADAFSEDANKCIEHGMNTHLAKPIDIDLLLRTLERLVEK
ncbi:MAG: response regulator [Lachnospiraceae bacterium]|nr:response regulator [Lachnospiraceae bacterium]